MSVDRHSQVTIDRSILVMVRRLTLIRCLSMLSAGLSSSVLFPDEQYRSALLQYCHCSSSFFLPEINKHEEEI